MNDVRIYDILWRTPNSGPSPDNNLRTEIYFGGCKRAMAGNPCPNCFNPDLWDGSKCYPKNPKDIVREIIRHEVPRYITIVGGEPTDQMPGLEDLIRELKSNGFHVMLFTWHSMDWLKDNMKHEIREICDIIVTEPYKADERIYDTSKCDGVHEVIGSGNQQVWIPREDRYYLAGELSELILNEKNEMKVIKNNGVCENY